MIAAAAFGFIGAMQPSFGDTPAKAPAAEAVNQLWRDSGLSAFERTEALLKAMTKEEKVALAAAVDPKDFASLEHLGIPPLTRVDASCGLRGDTGVTAFPVPLAIAASFDEGLATKIGAAIGEEARGKGWNVILGPTLDIARSPLCGRLTEAFGEDPILSGVFGAKIAAAMQSRYIISMLKHFTVYNQETDRMVLNVLVSERTMRELYNVPFLSAVEAGGADAVMASYPKVNGVFDCENKNILDALRAEPRFRGYIATDDAAGEDLVAQINAGVDSWAFQHGEFPRKAFFDGRISVERLDDATRRVLFATFKNGLFDNPLPSKIATVVTTPEHRQLALQAAEEATVLLKNVGNLLPLAKARSIAVIGPAGMDLVTGVQGSSYVNPGDFTTPVDAIRAAAGEAATVLVAQGSLGDVVLPSVPASALITSQGKPGVQVDLFDNADLSGPPLLTTAGGSIDLPPTDECSGNTSEKAGWICQSNPEGGRAEGGKNQC